MTFQKGHKDLVPKESRKEAGKKMIGNTFRKGKVPWNKGKKTSEEQKKKLSEAHMGKTKGADNWNYIDGRSKKLTSIKTIKGRRESHFVYCSQEGNHPYVPRSFVIHHIDLNPHNNEPDNLVMMQNNDHSSLHKQIHKIRKEGGII